MTIDPCWNRIGVLGDGSCPELERRIHCRNCPVHADAALQLIDRDLQPDCVAEWTQHYGKPKSPERRRERSVVIFRIDAEWLALPTRVVREIADRRPIHSLPHRDSTLVLGLVNVRGELLVCVSLGGLLGMEPSRETTGPAGRAVKGRLMVIEAEAVRAACPVDEIHGVHQVFEGGLNDVPTTLARAPASHSSAVVAWDGRSVGLLDEQSLFQAIERTLA